MKKIAILFPCIVLAVCLASCGGKVDSDIWETAVYTQDTELGQGEKTLYAEVTAEEKSVLFTVKTDEATVGEALFECGLISGEQGPYGLYIKTVNGIYADYDKTKSYWAITKNGEYLTTGADTTEFADGDKFELTYTR